jgi:hypothetical protein
MEVLIRHLSYVLWRLPASFLDTHGKLLDECLENTDLVRAGQPLPESFVIGDANCDAAAKANKTRL